MPVRDRLHKPDGVGTIAHASEGACSNYLVPQERNCSTRKIDTLGSGEASTAC